MDDPYDDPFYEKLEDDPANYHNYLNPGYFNPGSFKMKFTEGDSVEVVGNIGQYNQVGMIADVQVYVGQFVRLIGSPYNFYEQDLKLLAIPKEKLKERCDNARKNYHLWQAKLDYVEENNKEEFEESDFKKYTLKKLLNNNNLSVEDKIERIEAICGDV